MPTFPQARPEGSGPEEGLGGAMDTRRILIVEPDGAVSRRIASIAEARGLATDHAGSAAEAERVLSGPLPGLALIRAELPDRSGFALCTQLRRAPRTADLKVVLVSSEGAPDAVAAHAAGPGAADAYLGFPLDGGALAELLGRLLGPGAEEGPGADLREALQRLSEERARFADRERDHAAALERLLLEKLSQEQALAESEERRSREAREAERARRALEEEVARARGDAEEAVLFAQG